MAEGELKEQNLLVLESGNAKTKAGVCAFWEGRAPSLQVLAVPQCSHLTKGAGKRLALTPHEPWLPLTKLHLVILFKLSFSSKVHIFKYCHMRD